MAVRAAARSSGRCSRRLSAKNREESFRVDQRLGAGTRADPRWSLGEVGRARSSGRPHLRNVSLLQLGGRLRREARGAARGVRGRERKDGGPSARRTVRGRWRVRRNWKWGPAFRRGADEKEARWRKRKWGPALLPAPTAPSEGYAGVRNLVDKTLRPTYPLSILAHQLRRRFAPSRSLFRGTWLIYPTTWPESSLVVRSARSG